MNSIFSLGSVVSIYAAVFLLLETYTKKTLNYPVISTRYSVAYAASYTYLLEAPRLGRMYGIFSSRISAGMCASSSALYAQSPIPRSQVQWQLIQRYDITTYGR